MEKQFTSFDSICIDFGLFDTFKHVIGGNEESPMGINGEK